MLRRAAPLALLLSLGWLAPAMAQEPESEPYGILNDGQAAPSERTTDYLWKQCQEDALGLRIDPAPFREIVEPDFRLVLREGKATVAIIVQDCSQYWINGEDLGPTQHVHVWVEIEGEQDERPVAGAQHTLPTRTWFSLFAGSTNARGREKRRASGTSPQPIEGVSLWPDGTPPGGEVVVEPGRSYSWSRSSASGPPSLAGINHDVYHPDGAGGFVLKRISALGNLPAAPSPGTLEVVGGLEPSGVIPAGTYPVRVFTFSPVWARVTLGEDIPEWTNHPAHLRDAP